MSSISHRKNWCLLLMAVMMFSISGKASATTCAKTGNAMTAYPSADLAFVGELIDTEPKEGVALKNTYTFKIGMLLKGLPRGTVDIAGNGFGPYFTLGQSYVIAANKSNLHNGTYRVNTCNTFPPIENRIMPFLPFLGLFIIALCGYELFRVRSSSMEKRQRLLVQIPLGIAIIMTLYSLLLPVLSRIFS